MGGYVAKGWCRNDRCLSPHELNGVYACGSNLKSPEANCCACGKPAAPSPPPPPPPPPSCLSEDAQCGGAGQRDRTCCAGLTCQVCSEATVSTARRQRAAFQSMSSVGAQDSATVHAALVSPVKVCSEATVSTARRQIAAFQSMHSVGAQDSATVHAALVSPVKVCSEAT